MRRSIWRRYFESLAEGDPIALAVTGFFAVLGIIVLIFWIMDRREKAREQVKATKKSRK